MNVMDVIGPVMVGPSSSHTAGAVRIGKVSRRLLGENVAAAHIGLYGSFLATGRGHGTDKAIIAGLLGMDVDDMAIPDAFDIARSIGMTFDFYDVDLGEDAHPNSAKLELTGVNGKELEIVASSIGGGRIVIQELDHLTAKTVNIATMQLYRSGRGGYAVMVLECDQEVPAEALNWLKKLEGVLKVTYLSLLEDIADDRIDRKGDSHD